jgi:hypothetical protein
MRRISRGLVLFYLSFGACLVARAQNLGSLRLHVETADGRSTYTKGEKIPLILSFSASQRGHCLSFTTGERVWRDSPETVLLDGVPVLPTGARAEDPFVDLGDFGIALRPSYLSSNQEIRDTPERIEIDLNQWVRFKTQGQFKIAIVSRRVRRNCGAEPQANSLEVTSNEIGLTILEPDREWLSSEEQKLRKLIFSPALPSRSALEAVHRLRYLDTRGSAAALVDCLADLACSASPASIEESLVQMPKKSAILTGLEDAAATATNFAVKQRIEAVKSIVRMLPQ